jgi:3-oxoacyl-[acyl-carrier protein] reductase
MNKLDLVGRVAVVTGGARGIGLAVARRMIQSGAAVSIWDVDPAKAEESRVALAADGSVTAEVLDLTDELAVAYAARKTAAAHGKIDILVNNAGITGGNMPSWEIPVAQWRRVMEVNLNAPFIVASAVVPHLLANGWGRVVNVASVAGKEGNPNAAHYSASKAGLIGYTKSLAKELAQKGVLVNCVTPAAAKTEIFNQMTEQHIAFMLSKIPMGRFVEVEEIAALICWLSSPDCSFSTGAVFDVSGGRATY